VHRLLTWIAFSAVVVVGARAQDEDAALPVTEVAEGEPVPVVRFVAVVGERAPRPRDDRSDRRVTLWSVPPGAPAVRRVVLGHSYWNPTPLRGSAEVLRWQLPTTSRRERPYDVELLRVDYRDFRVTRLLRAAQADAFGGAGRLLYLNTSEGQRVLDVDKNTLVPLEPEIELVAAHGEDWLVEVDGHLARFDAATAEVQRRFDGIEVRRHRDVRAFTEWDGGRFAVRHGRFVDEQGEPVDALGFMQLAVVIRELHVWDLELGVCSDVKVRTQARGGSGVPVIPVELPTELVGGLFRYVERRPAEGEHADLADFDWERDAEWVTIDIATGKELLREPYRPRDLPVTDPMDVNRVPEYLREGFGESPIRAWGPDQDLAYAFLVHKGIDPQLPTNGVCRFDAVCRTEDGAQLLVLNRDTLFACDLVAQTVSSWAAPAEWRDVQVDLHAVVTR